MINHDVDQPMGNAELRLSFAELQSEIIDVKSIALETRTGQKYTNGKVMWLTKGAWLVMGALPLLTIWSMWLTKETLDRDKASSVEQSAVVQAAVLKALDDYDDTVTK